MDLSIIALPSVILISHLEKFSDHANIHPMNDVHSLLMTYEDYLKASSSNTYYFKIEKEGKYLFYFGSNHSRNPEDDQYCQIQKYWEDFSKIVDKSDASVFVEGGARNVSGRNIEEIINSDAEAGFITYLAEGYPVSSPEPSIKLLTDALLGRYTQEEIEYYYFARVVAQWGSIPSKPEFAEYIKPFLERDKEELQWNDFDFSLEQMKEIHTKLFKESFDENKTDFFLSISDPTNKSTVINCVSQDQGADRDAYIVNQILDEWEKGKSVFVVYGSTHAVIQEPALRKLL